MKYELELRGLTVKAQQELPMKYKELNIPNAYRLDLLVEDKVIIEIKSVEALSNMHHKQIITYLKISNLKLGILVNFNADDLKSNIIRKVNNH